jgi:hypothetical protein
MVLFAALTQGPGNTFSVRGSRRESYTCADGFRNWAEPLTENLAATEGFNAQPNSGVPAG